MYKLYRNFFEKSFIKNRVNKSDYVNMLYILDYIIEINELFQWASQSGYYKIVKLLLKNKRVNQDGYCNHIIEWVFKILLKMNILKLSNYR